jgi:hypothetical protein
MTRDPLREPTYGDVFEFVGVGIKYKALFMLGEAHPTTNDDWIGMTLDDGYGIAVGSVTAFASLNRGAWATGWEFVEHIDGHAEGGLFTKEMLERALAPGATLASWQKELGERLGVWPSSHPKAKP